MLLIQEILVFRCVHGQPAPLDFRLLDPTHALYVGRWALAYPNGTSAKGYTSLLMALEPGGWRIIADHSS